MLTIIIIIIKGYNENPTPLPHYLSDGFYQRAYSEVVDEGSVPRIPVQPISYQDALHFMSQLNDIAAPSDCDWVGELDISYNITQSSNSTR